jgi:heme-degrading monooxygenase HmoA
VFASIRRYRLRGGSMQELARRVDVGFAEDLAREPGFVAYEFMDCGDGEMLTLSVFREPGQAEASRLLAQRWTERNLEDLEFSRLEALRGELVVSRAAEDMLEPGHIGDARKFASVRRFTMQTGDLSALLHIVDDVFADEIAAMDGFDAYHVLHCGDQGVTFSLFRDRAAAEASDELSAEFVRRELGSFGVERPEVFRGEVLVSRAMAALLEPAHA